MTECEHCGAMRAEHCDGQHVCEREPIYPRKRKPTKPIEEHNSGRVDNAWLLKRKGDK